MGIPEGRMARHRAQVAAAEASAAGGGGALVLVGDSITQGWQTEGHDELLRPHRTVNLGTSGDRTEQMIWRLQNGELPAGIRPRAFTLMAGTNNAGLMRDEPAHIADGILAIIDLLLAADATAPILLYPIFPRGRGATCEMRRITDGANRSLLARLPKSPRIIVRDIRQQFLNDWGETIKNLMPDYLHLSRAGYEIWAKDLHGALATVQPR